MFRLLILSMGIIILLLIAVCFFEKPAGTHENPELAKNLVSDTRHEDSAVFIQMADTQFGMLTEYLSKLSIGVIGDDYLFPPESKNFETAIQYANFHKVDFAIVCGDLVHDFYNLAQREEFQRIASQLDSSIPLYLVSGNHDVGAVPTKRYLQEYRALYGADWYSFQIKNVYGIVLNSSLIANSTSAPNEELAQRRWLEEELKIANKQIDKNIWGCPS